MLAGTAQIDPDRRGDVIAAAVETMRRTRIRPGCITFVCAADLEDPNLLHIFLEWETADGLFDLLTPERVAAFRQNAEKIGVRNVSVARYEIKSVGPIA